MKTLRLLVENTVYTFGQLPIHSRLGTIYAQESNSKFTSKPHKPPKFSNTHVFHHQTAARTRIKFYHKIPSVDPSQMPCYLIRFITTFLIEVMLAGTRYIAKSHNGGRKDREADEASSQAQHEAAAAAT
jgi:hypothetical protein